MSKILKFPKNFLWGAATSAHQVEGENRNDWSEWEKKNAPRLALLARGKQWQDWQKERFPEMFDKKNYISGIACDHYHKFKEDFDLAKSLGHNAHRFSIEWSRIEPEEGKFNEKEIEHYKQVILALRERGIEPFVTLWHWTIPIWLAKKGGWFNKDAPKYFERYVEKIITSCDNVNFWITLNEPMVFISYGWMGLRPPKINGFLQAFKIFRNLVLAHKKAYKIINKHGNQYQVGIAKHNKSFITGDNKLHNKIFTKISKFLWNDCFLWKIKNYQDFVGLNYYNCDMIKFSWKDTRKGFYNLHNSPEGFYYVLIDLKKYKKPIYVLENGINDSTDKNRLEFIKSHITFLGKAIEQGVNIKGYFHWSLLDNFEWENGFEPRFGLVEVDYKTMERKIRKSAYAYAKICKTNELDL